MANGPDQPTSPLGAVSRPTLLLQQAAFALQNQRPREAERMTREILHADPRHIQASSLLGSALLMQGRVEDAIPPLENATRGRNDPRAETQLAIALRLAGRLNDALGRLKRVVKRQPAHGQRVHGQRAYDQSAYGEALLELGIVLAAMARYDEAIEALRRGSDIAPMAPRLPTELGYLYLQRRDWALAKIAFARALAISPDISEALFGMAKAHQEVGEYESAISYFRRYLARHPHDERARLTFGHCLLEHGRLDEGYECFRKAAQGDPKRYYRALNSLVASSRGRFWLKPSAAARYFRVPHAQ